MRLDPVLVVLGQARIVVGAQEDAFNALTYVAKQPAIRLELTEQFFEVLDGLGSASQLHLQLTRLDPVLDSPVGIV